MIDYSNNKASRLEEHFCSRYNTFKILTSAILPQDRRSASMKILFDHSLIYPWKVVQKIGSGKFSEVFEVMNKENPSLPHKALKVKGMSKIEYAHDYIDFDKKPTKACIDSAYIEAQITAKINKQWIHEVEITKDLAPCKHIMKIHDHRVIQDKESDSVTIFIWTDLLTPLNAYIRSQSLTIKDVLTIGIQICEAIECLNNASIIHRDIKPSNILVSDDGDFILNDFDLSIIHKKPNISTPAVGTYNFMAPEIFNGKSYNKSVDVYSLGIVLYQLLNDNKLPFQEDYFSALSWKERNSIMRKRFADRAIKSPFHAESGLDKIILKAIAFAPRERFSDAKTLKKSLLNSYSAYNSYGSVAQVVYEPDPEDQMNISDEMSSANFSIDVSISDLFDGLTEVEESSDAHKKAMYELEMSQAEKNSDYEENELYYIEDSGWDDWDTTFSEDQKQDDLKDSDTNTPHVLVEERNDIIKDQKKKFTRLEKMNYWEDIMDLSEQIFQTMLSEYLFDSLIAKAEDNTWETGLYDHCSKKVIAANNSNRYIDVSQYAKFRKKYLAKSGNLLACIDITFAYALINKDWKEIVEDFDEDHYYFIKDCLREIKNNVRNEHDHQPVQQIKYINNFYADSIVAIHTIKRFVEKIWNKPFGDLFLWHEFSETTRAKIDTIYKKAIDLENQITGNISDVDDSNNELSDMPQLKKQIENVVINEDNSGTKISQAIEISNVQLNDFVYRKTVLEPSKSFVLLRLGEVLKEQGKYKDAEHFLRMALEEFQRN